MKVKQLEVIQERADAFQAKLRVSPGSKPDAQCHIIRALVRGENVPLRPLAEICEAAREKIAGCSYSSDRDLSLGKVFAEPASYRKALREYEAAEKTAKAKAAAFEREATLIITEARLSDTSDADEVMKQVYRLATKHGVN